MRSPLDLWLGHEELASTAPPSAYESCMSVSTGSSPEGASTALGEARDGSSMLKQGALEVRVLRSGGAARPGRSGGIGRGKPPSCPSTPPPSPRPEINVERPPSREADASGHGSSSRVLSRYEARPASTGSKNRSLVGYSAAQEHEEGGDISTDDPDDEDLCFFA